MRQQAREGLVRIGSPATAAICAALADDNEQVRWEAAKTLAETGDPAAVTPLVAALRDEDSDVRWVVGEALIRIGAPAIEPILSELTRKADTIGLYPAARHVLRHLAVGPLADPLDSVINAFQAAEPEIAVPVAAEEAHEQLSKG